MIVSEPASPSLRLRSGTLDAGTPGTQGAPGGTWRCLSRRGMLHSECESFEQIRLGPGATWAHAPSHGTEAALYAVSGSASVHTGAFADGDGPGDTGDADGDGAGVRALGAGGALLVAARAAVRLTAGSEGLDLLAVRLLPADVISQLPSRVPELPSHLQAPIFRPATSAGAD
ncbi:hypothetical protein ABZ990_13135 [Streptomyces sp. NPDC046203]|uniref:hypothetical protein n=1 Tax=Streptomyces sp. NPDC046203 TaxID=3154602 RepID=UPI0033F6D00C